MTTTVHIDAATRTAFSPSQLADAERAIRDHPDWWYDPDAEVGISYDAQLSGNRMATVRRIDGRLTIVFGPLALGYRLYPVTRHECWHIQQADEGWLRYLFTPADQVRDLEDVNPALAPIEQEPYFVASLMLSQTEFRRVAAGHPGLVNTFIDYCATNAITNPNWIVRQPMPDPSQTFAWPVPGYTSVGEGLGSWPDWREKMGLLPHSGIDIRASEGAAVLAPAMGVVSIISNEGIGNAIRISTALILEDPESGATDPIRRNRTHLYIDLYHLFSIDVGAGELVSPFQRIGTVGSTGTFSTGPHLHMSIYRFDQAPDEPGGVYWLDDPSRYYGKEVPWGVEPMLHGVTRQSPYAD